VFHDGRRIDDATVRDLRARLDDGQCEKLRIVGDLRVGRHDRAGVTDATESPAVGLEPLLHAAAHAHVADRANSIHKHDSVALVRSEDFLIAAEHRQAAHPGAVARALRIGESQNVHACTQQRICEHCRVSSCSDDDRRGCHGSIASSAW
jgi:hypothetical protein